MTNSTEPTTLRRAYQPPLQRIDRHIAMVTTDTTGMKETAFGSLETCRSLCDALETRYSRVTFNHAETEKDLRAIAARKPDLVVLGVKYIVDVGQHKKIWLSDFFSSYDIAYTGSSRATLEFDSNKSKAKTLLLNKGIATAKFFLSHPGQFLIEQLLPLPLPLFIKPLDAANGNGIDENSLVHDFASYQSKVQEIFTTYGVATLVEQVLPGREFTVAVLDDPVAGTRLISPVEIIAPRNVKGDRVLGFREKSSNREKLLAVSEPTRGAVAALADQVFTELGVCDFGRIDIKMDARGEPHFIEANLVPGMTPGTSYFPRACEINSGMDYEGVVLKIAELALNRRTLAAAV